MQEALLNVEAQQEEGTKQRRIPGWWLMMPVTVTFLCAGAAGMATMFKPAPKAPPEPAAFGNAALKGSSGEQGAVQFAIKNTSGAALNSQLNASSTNWSAPAGILRNMSQPSPVALFTYGDFPIGYPDFPSDSDSEIIIVDDPDSGATWRDPFGSGAEDILDNGDDDVPEWEAAGSDADTDEPYDDLSDQDDPFFDEPDFGPTFPDSDESPPDWSEDGLPLGDMDDGPFGDLGDGLLGGGDGLPLVGEVPIEPIPLALASAANVTSAEAHAENSARSNKSAALQLRADSSKSSHSNKLHIGNSTMNATEIEQAVAPTLDDYIMPQVINTPYGVYYDDGGSGPPSADEDLLEQDGPFLDEPIPLGLASAAIATATAAIGSDVNNTIDTVGRNSSAEARAGPQSISRFRGRA